MSLLQQTYSKRYPELTNLKPPTELRNLRRLHFACAAHRKQATLPQEQNQTAHSANGSDKKVMLNPVNIEIQVSVVQGTDRPGSVQRFCFWAALQKLLGVSKLKRGWLMHSKWSTLVAECHPDLPLVINEKTTNHLGRCETSASALGPSPVQELP